MSFRHYTEEEWPTWNVNPASPPVITVEGHNIQSVFSMINKQLETLRRTVMNQDRALKDAARREEQLKDKHAVQLTKLNSRIDGLTNKINDGDVGKMENRINVAENKIVALERQIAMERGSTMKSVLDNQEQVTSGHNSRLESLEKHIVRVEEGVLNSQRIIDCEKNVSTLLSARTDLHTRVVHLEDGQAWFTGESTKMSKNYEDLLKNHDVSMREINELQNELYINYKTKIDQLFEEKLDKNKDLDAMLAKHLLSEGEDKEFVQRFQGLLEDLDRRVLLLGSECREDLDRMKHKADKKIDFLHKWIVKYVGTAMKSEKGEYETDIGTVRCLVCNHPTKKVDTDTPYVVPDFKNTLGYYHDENNDRDRSPSPPLDPKYRTGSPPRDRNGDGLRNSGTKFAKLKSVPAGTPEYFNEYPDHGMVHLDVTQDTYQGPRTISDPKLVAFYNDMTRYNVKTYIRDDKWPCV